MKVRAALAAGLIGALAATAVGVSPGVSAGGGSATGSRAETVTVTGDLERIVVETVDGEEIRYAVRDADRTWWLEGLAEPAPAPGSSVEVTGAPRDEYTLSVATIRVTGDATSALQTSAAVRGTTRMLVLRAFWGARPPARPTTATTLQKVVSASGRWFREVSHGRYSISGSVTPWLRVSDRATATTARSGEDQALAAARRAGFHLATLPTIHPLPAVQRRRHPRLRVAPGPARRRVQHHGPERHGPRAGPQPRPAARRPHASARVRPACR